MPGPNSRSSPAAPSSTFSSRTASNSTPSTFCPTRRCGKGSRTILSGPRTLRCAPTMSCGVSWRPHAQQHQHALPLRFLLGHAESAVSTYPLCVADYVCAMRISSPTRASCLVLPSTPWPPHLCLLPSHSLARSTQRASLWVDSTLSRNLSRPES